MIRKYCIFPFLCALCVLVFVSLCAGQEASLKGFTQGLTVDEKRQMLLSLKQTLQRIRTARTNLKTSGSSTKSKGQTVPSANNGPGKTSSTVTRNIGPVQPANRVKSDARAHIRPAQTPRVANAALIQAAKRGNVAPAQPPRGANAALIQAAKRGNVGPVQPVNRGNSGPVQPANRRNIRPMMPTNKANVGPVSRGNVRPIQSAKRANVGPVQQAPRNIPQAQSLRKAPQQHLSKRPSHPSGFPKQPTSNGNVRPQQPTATRNVGASPRAMIRPRGPVMGSGPINPALARGAARVNAQQPNRGQNLGNVPPQQNSRNMVRPRNRIGQNPRVRAPVDRASTRGAVPPPQLVRRPPVAQNVPVAPKRGPAPGNAPGPSVPFRRPPTNPNTGSVPRGGPPPRNIPQNARQPMPAANPAVGQSQGGPSNAANKAPSGKSVGISVQVQRKTEVNRIPDGPVPPSNPSAAVQSSAHTGPGAHTNPVPTAPSSTHAASSSGPRMHGSGGGHTQPMGHTTAGRHPVPTSPSRRVTMPVKSKPPPRTPPPPTRITLPRFIRWETLYPSGVVGMETAEALPAQSLVLITSDDVPMYDEFYASSTLMDFHKGLVAIRVDMPPRNAFMPPMKVCFTMKNPGTFKQTKKELLRRSKSTMAVELGEVMHMVAAASNVQDTHTLQRTAGPFISKFCEEALLTNNVYKLVPEAPVEPGPQTISVSGLVTPLDPGRSLTVSVAIDTAINFYGPNNQPTQPPP